MGLKIYEVTPKYVDYIVPLAPHLFQNKQPGQHNERKYVGIVLTIKGFNYFAPLSSFKPKHKKSRKAKLSQRCNDFSLLEQACKKYKSNL